jgi:hypothetical protein
MQAGTFSLMPDEDLQTKQTVDVFDFAVLHLSHADAEIEGLAKKSKQLNKTCEQQSKDALAIVPISAEPTKTRLDFIRTTLMSLMTCFGVVVAVVPEITDAGECERMVTTDDGRVQLIEPADPMIAMRTLQLPVSYIRLPMSCLANGNTGECFAV